MAKHSSHILELARKGAEHRLEELRLEIAALIHHFPHLGKGTRSRRLAQIDLSSEPAATIDWKPLKKRHRMSAAARRAVSLRMTKYWAARRKAKKA
jgi:hypothetical protein